MLGLMVVALLLALYAIYGIAYAAFLSSAPKFLAQARIIALIHEGIFLLALIAFIGLIVAFKRLPRARVPIPESDT